MSNLFGGMDKSRDIATIIESLRDRTTSLTESAGKSVSEIEVSNMADEIRTMMINHNTGLFDSHFDHMLQEDAEGAAQMFMNNMNEMSNSTLNETTIMPGLVTLTASIATTMRTPYEAVLHRLYDTRTLDKQTVEIEEVIPTVKAPFEEKDEDMIDALAPYAATRFVDRTEIEVETLTAGIVPGPDCRNMPLLEGKNPLFRINRDVRIAKLDVEIDGETIPQEKIVPVKGSGPYFDAKDNTMNAMFNCEKADGTIVSVVVDAQIDFQYSTMKYLHADDEVKKVYFYATVDHAEHTHPVQLGFKNNFSQYCVPSRPHLEVSLPQEVRTDIQNSIQHFANTDIITAMTENITTVVSRMEDQRLMKGIESGHMFEGEWCFEAPANFALGNLEWFRKEFIPFLDQIALKMKNDWNITDCHFRVAVSPYILRIMDTDYTLDKSMNEEGKGSGVINYSIGCKTSTSTFYFVSSQMIQDNMLHVLLIPNNFTNSQVKTYNYFKYSSFLTDQLRRSDNPVMNSIVYSERNLPVVFCPVQTKVAITELPIMKSSGAKYVVRV